MIPRAIITGCDSRQLHLIPWWVRHLRYGAKCTLPVVVGVTEALAPALGKFLADAQVQVVQVPPLVNRPVVAADNYGGRAPKLLLPDLVQAQTLMWADLDCQFLRDPTYLFDLVEPDLTMDNIALRPDLMDQEVQAARLLPGEQIYNGGMYLTRRQGTVTATWRRVLPMLWGWYPGDQSILARVLHELHCSPVRIPDSWNTFHKELPAGQAVPADINVIHYVAPSGKRLIQDDVDRCWREAVG